MMNITSPGREMEEMEMKTNPKPNKKDVIEKHSDEPLPPQPQMNPQAHICI